MITTSYTSGDSSTQSDTLGGLIDRAISNQDFLICHEAALTREEIRKLTKSVNRVAKLLAPKKRPKKRGR